jgi:putative tryptophan/tyrosine transport system substrate-binding protein
MRRREFIAALGGGAAFAFAARAEHPERVRRVGVLIYGSEDDPVTETRVEGLREGLHRLDWVEGHNLALVSTSAPPTRAAFAPAQRSSSAAAPT